MRSRPFASAGQPIFRFAWEPLPTSGFTSAGRQEQGGGRLWHRTASPAGHSPPSFGSATGEDSASGEAAASSFLGSTISSGRFLSRESMDHLLTK